MERHGITFDDLVGLIRLDHVELGDGPTPEDGSFLNVISDVGRFTFPARTGRRQGVPAIDPTGFWEPDVAMAGGLGIVTMCRFAPTTELVYRRMYCVDEATGLVVLEFGSITKQDDPNLPGWREGVFRWDGGRGWESPYLETHEGGEVEILRRFEFHPKRVHRGPPKGRF